MNRVAPPSAQPCVWMTAGLVTYKLCDRDFDCRRCALDAALRGGAAPSTDPGFLPGPTRRAEGFPEDRRYAAGHTWVAEGPRPGNPAVRVGLDGFAAALLTRPVAATCVDGPAELERGDVMCDVELPEGVLSLLAPLAGRVERCNPALREHPGLIVESPYTDGWLLDLVPSMDEAGLEGLLDAAEARERSALDLRRFRRRVALHLLADVAPVGPCMADGGEALTSVSEILGGARYLETLNEILR